MFPLYNAALPGSHRVSDRILIETDRDLIGLSMYTVWEIVSAAPGLENLVLFSIGFLIGIFPIGISDRKGGEIVCCNPLY